MVLIYFVLFSLLIISLILQYLYFGGFNYDFISSLIPNVVITILGLLLSIIVIDNLLKKQKLRDDREVVKNILGNQYQNFVSEISNIFLYYVLKQPPKLEGGFSIEGFNKLTNQVILNIEDYIDDEFIFKPIQVMNFNPLDIWNPTYREIDYFDFCDDYFKKSINTNIVDFLGKYISIIPTDIRISIFIIMDNLSSPIFTSPKKLGININKTNTSFEGSSMIRVINNIGVEIEKLQRIMIENK